MIFTVVAVAIGFHILATASLEAWRGWAARGRDRGVPAKSFAALKSRVSVIVPVWNDAAVIGSTLEYLKRETVGLPSVEVFVVAGGADGSFGAAGRAINRVCDPGQKWHLLEQPARGKNAALNLGLERSVGDIFVILDADTHVEVGWLQALCGPLEAGDFDAVTGSFEPHLWSPTSRVFVADQVHAQQIRRSITLFGGGTIAMSRTALDRIGGRLPEDVVVGVDWDLSHRIRSAGCRLGFCPGARVRTEISHDWAEYYRNEVRWRRAFYRIELNRLKKHLSWRLLAMLGYVALIQALLLGGWLVLPTLALVAGLPAASGLQAWLLFVLWVLVRHVSRLLSVACFSGDHSWLRQAPAYTAAFIVSAAASLHALATLGSQTPHFKGSRAVAR